MQPGDLVAKLLPSLHVCSLQHINVCHVTNFLMLKQTSSISDSPLATFSTQKKFLLTQSFLFCLCPTDWIRLTHIMESNLFYSKPTGLNVYHIYKMLSQQHLGWC